MAAKPKAPKTDPKKANGKMPMAAKGGSMKKRKAC